MSQLLSQTSQGQRVNSAFGEGVNPRRRKIRDGLDALGLPTDDLLNHGCPWLVYAVELVRNTRNYLLGIDRQPDYILGQRQAADATCRIAWWWAGRWLVPRLVRDDVLDRVRSHNLIYPIRHGARVRMPGTEAAQPSG